MPRLRIKVPVDVDVEPVTMDVVEKGVALVRAVRESGLVDAAADLFKSVSRARRSRRRR